MTIYIILLIIIAKPSIPNGPTSVKVKPAIDMIKESLYQTGVNK